MSHSKFKYRYSYHRTLNYPCPTLIIPTLPNIILILTLIFFKDLNNTRDTCDTERAEFFPFDSPSEEALVAQFLVTGEEGTMIFQSKVIAKRPSQRPNAKGLRTEKLKLKKTVSIFL